MRLLKITYGSQNFRDAPRPLKFLYVMLKCPERVTVKENWSKPHFLHGLILNFNNVSVFNTTFVWDSECPQLLNFGKLKRRIASKSEMKSIIENLFMHPNQENVQYVIKPCVAACLQRRTKVTLDWEWRMTLTPPPGYLLLLVRMYWKGHKLFVGMSCRGFRFKYILVDICHVPG